MLNNPRSITLGMGERRHVGTIRKGKRSNNLLSMAVEGRGNTSSEESSRVEMRTQEFSQQPGEDR